MLRIALLFGGYGESSDMQKCSPAGLLAFGSMRHKALTMDREDHVAGLVN